MDVCWPPCIAPCSHKDQARLAKFNQCRGLGRVGVEQGEGRSGRGELGAFRPMEGGETGLWHLGWILTSVSSPRGLLRVVPAISLEQLQVAILGLLEHFLG